MAQYTAGEMLRKGMGVVRKDYHEAAKWYRKAADQGDAAGQYHLGSMYFYGRGVAKDFVESVRWYRKAAEQGHDLAQNSLGSSYEHGRGFSRDYVSAHMWFNLAASGGFDFAGENRKRVEKRMTPGQIATARKLARTWQPRKDRPAERSRTTPRSSPSPSTSSKITSTGTAFFVSADGHLLTNHHVVDGCRELRLPSKEKLTLVAIDKTNDLALLLGKPNRSGYARFRSGRGIRLGAGVVVAGYPFRGLLTSGLTVTKGTVSALAGILDNPSHMQISAPVQSGNSGGPLLDESANVVGVVVSKLNALGLAKITGDLPQNVNFAIKAAVARAFLEARHIDYGVASSREKMEPEHIAEKARGVTVPVECWAR